MVTEDGLVKVAAPARCDSSFKRSRDPGPRWRDGVASVERISPRIER